MNIYVGNLPFSTSQEELRSIFAAFGEVSAARIVSDRETGRPKGFGFVDMPNAEEAKNAIEALNGNDIGGRKAVVNEARPREPRRWIAWVFPVHPVTVVKNPGITVYSGIFL